MGEIAELERRLTGGFKQDAACHRIAAIPRIGVLTATAVVATRGDAHAFRSGRGFADWLGWVPRQRGTGGRIQLPGISKRGDTCLRRLLIQGARAVLLHSKQPSPGVVKLAQRRPTTVAVVAKPTRPREHAGPCWPTHAYGKLGT